ncbi:hypothetical protein ABKN59_009457 [Abortiporus biennis]
MLAYRAGSWIFSSKGLCSANPDCAVCFDFSLFSLAVFITFGPVFEAASLNRGPCRIFRPHFSMGSWIVSVFTGAFLSSHTKFLIVLFVRNCVIPRTMNSGLYQH